VALLARNSNAPQGGASRLSGTIRQSTPVWIPQTPSLRDEAQVIGELDKLDPVIERIVETARIPGAAVAIVSGGETVFSKGYGYRDLATKLPVTPQTVYPIASTTKAITATLVGTFVDEGALSWDAPVQSYLPRFQLWDRESSFRITLRDLFSMRTGLPRHDWLWSGSTLPRGRIVDRLRHLELSAGFRERFQYNNLLITLAGYVTEVIAGRRWEDLVQSRILDPLGMTRTVFTRPASGDVTEAYHEGSRRELCLTRRFAAEITGPSGGSIYSTVLDMAKWALFNLKGGQTVGRQLIKPETLAEIQFPQMIVGKDPVAPTAHAAYAMGWFVDTYNGRLRISHGGHLHDVKSDVALFPQDDLALVSFVNLGAPVPARLINQYAFDLLKGLQPAQSLEDVLAQHEKKIEDNRRRIAAVRRVSGTSASHSLDEYAGSYEHPGYGTVEIERRDRVLLFKLNELVLPLEHWHYDAWVAQESELFGIHESHPFDRASRILFESNEDGEVAALTVRLEPAVARIRFTKQRVYHS
jgi:CubicO group peptidase (beta-lactamase class C family)